MKQDRRGRIIRLSTGRRIITDLMRLAHDMPAVPIVRRMHLAETAQSRLAADERIGWAAIMIRSVAIVSSRRPELRRSYIRFPTPHLYEHTDTIGTISVEREHEGENIVLFNHVRHPEQKTLSEIGGYFQEWKSKPIEEVSRFRRILRIGRLPSLIRRAVWFLGYHVSGNRRARNFGTFSLSPAASVGAMIARHQSPLAFTFSYGPIDSDGRMDVSLTFDHRVVDGAVAGRALAELEHVLRNDIRMELEAMRPRTGTLRASDSATVDSPDALPMYL